MRFKKRDKVLVYGYVPRDPTSLLYKKQPMAFLRGTPAKVILVVADDEIVVRFAYGYETEVHPKQCRRAK